MNKQDKEYIELLINNIEIKIDSYIKQQKIINYILVVLIIMSVLGFENGLKSVLAGF